MAAPPCSLFRSRLGAAPTDDAMMIRDRVSETRFRVRYAETDQMGFAHHSNHLVWFEVARLEFFRELDLSYDRLERESETFLPVVEIHCRYMKPLFYDWEFVIRTRLKRLGRRGMTFGYRIVDPNGGVNYARGESRHIATNRHGRPCSFPDYFLRACHLDDGS